MRFEEKIRVECLECGKEARVDGDSIYVTIAGVNYFCPGGDCEDKYASKL